MTLRTRNLTFVIIITVAILYAGVSSPDCHADIRQTIAAAYGAQHFASIHQIRYTFNVKIGDRRISRAWVWEPKTDQVTFVSDPNEKSIHYSRKDVTAGSSAKALKKIDAWFINDNYWLLFPLRVAWDPTVRVEEANRTELPMGSGTAKCVVITYPPAGGYTPGDVYELFIDDAYRITHWVYRRAAAADPTRITTWEDYRTVGPLTIAMDHRGSDPDFRVWFTDVAVKTTDDSAWLLPR